MATDVFGIPDLVQILTQGISFMQQSIQQAQQLQLQRQSLDFRQKEQEALMRSREKRMKMDRETLKLREEQLLLSQQAEMRLGESAAARQAVDVRHATVAEKREKRLSQPSAVPTSALFTPDERANIPVMEKQINRTISQMPVTTPGGETFAGLTLNQIDSAVNSLKVGLNRARSSLVAISPAGKETITTITNNLDIARKVRKEKITQFWETAKELPPRMQSALGVISNTPKPEDLDFVGPQQVSLEDQISAAGQSSDAAMISSVKDAAVARLVANRQQGVANAVSTQIITDIYNELGPEAAREVNDRFNKRIK